MTGILLDTNALLWLAVDPARLAPSALMIIEDPANALYVSAVSAWEIAIKTRLGRLDGTLLLSVWQETLEAMTAVDLVVDAADAVAAGMLNWDHRDPFDRMIVAQASRRGLTVATSDQVVLDGTRTPVLNTRR